jgi:hypothetical protein
MDVKKLAYTLERCKDSRLQWPAGPYFTDEEIDTIVRALRTGPELLAALDKIQAMEWPAGDPCAGAGKASEMYQIADDATRAYYFPTSPSTAGTKR